MNKRYLAVDLGASGGRCIAGAFDGNRLALQEIHRFPNGPTEIRGTFHWNFLGLYREIRHGMAQAKRDFGPSLASMGVDTWGVDFGLLDANGFLLGEPVHYRDRRTDAMPEKVFAAVGRETVFEQTGIQVMPLNTLYQLYALAQAGDVAYRHAQCLLFSPDLLNYWLTGIQAAERTIAGTSQCYNPIARDWAYPLLEGLGIRTDLFAPFADPCTVLGPTDDGLPVVATGSHDTASAFAAVPMRPCESCAILSSGTWSLLGIERDAPIVHADALLANVTNEIGLADTIRFLKNLSGLWILQELRREEAEQGRDRDWPALCALAEEAPPFALFLDPADPVFVPAGPMACRIRDLAQRSGQKPPQDIGAMVRAVLEGLAFLYAETLETLERLTGAPRDTVRIVGGGCRNDTLNQWTANATGRRVVAGPAEATAIGNLLSQMIALGDVASLTEARTVVRRSFADEADTREPCDREQWLAMRATWREKTSVRQ